MLGTPSPEQQTSIKMTKMVLINFKSYAGRVEIGPFHDRFSAVVGPNGSGKSNVIDALLFVFGFRAKKLRQGSLKDLIHNSASFPDLDHAIVEIFFGGQQELKVSRKVTLKASQYYLNDNPTTYGEIQELLKSLGIDLDHKRFLILQGEVESISLMKPKGENDDGLLEYLEDIIGTSGHKAKIEDALLQLDQRTEEYEQSLSSFKVTQKETQKLKNESELALKYLVLENKITLLSSQIYQRERRDNERLQIESAEKIGEIEQEISNQKLEHSSLIESEGTRASEIHAQEQEIKKLRKQWNELKEEVTKFEKMEIQLKETEKFNSNKKKKLLKEITEEKYQRSEDFNWINNHQNDVAQKEKEKSEFCTKLEVEEQKLQEITDSLKDKTSVFQAQIEEKQRELSPWLEKIAVLEGEIKVLDIELNILEDKISSGPKALEIAEIRLKEVKSELQEKIEKFNDFSEQEKEVSKNIDKQQDAITMLEKLCKDQTAIVQDHQRQLDEAKTATETSQSQNRVTKALMTQKKIKGICGRLGELGSIDSKYDVAISTACGYGLDSIVVDNVNAAQQAIDYLKTNNLGRATFYCLDKIKNQPSKEVNHTRLIDLVKTESKYTSAFYQALGETIVADSMQEAEKIAYGKVRHRVVTLDGQVIEKSGAMSGGGGRVVRGAMSSKAKSKNNKEFDIQALEQQLKDSTNILEQRTIQFESTQQLLVDQKKRKEFICEELMTLNLDVESLKAQHEDAVDNVSIAKKSAKVDPADIRQRDNLLASRANLVKDLDENSSHAQGLQSILGELQQRIMAVGGVRLRSQIGKVQSIKEQLSSLQQSITKSIAEKGARERNLNKLQKSIERKENTLKQIENELEELEVKRNEVSEQAEIYKTKTDEINQAYSNLEEEVADVKGELAEITQKLNKVRAVEVELRSKLTQLQQQEKACHSRIKQLEGMLSNLEIQKTGFEEYDDQELEIFDDDALDEIDLKLTKQECEKAKQQLQKLSPNLGVLDQYRTKMELYKKRSEDLAAKEELKQAAKNEYDMLRQNRLTTFMTGFKAISQKLKEMYQMITMGGNAELELVDSLDPFSEGVVFSVMPPKKSWKNIANLSGGEKTLSSLALVFALHHFKPTPIYVMDEIDAALDFRNVSIVANYIKQRTSNAQFIIISLRNNMFELADRLVGIYKTDNTSKSITIDPHAIRAQ